jgi:serine/threonine protein kinase
MKRVVAIKVLTRSVGASDQFLHRFQREVEAVARLSHPNIVMAYDADEAEVGHYLVMEFVDGRDLATEVYERGPLPVHEAVHCVAQVARALEYVHTQGIIHRDIKPANLLRDHSGIVKLTDLGLARFNDSLSASPARSSLTQAGTIMGTVDFMPPEQALGVSDIDHRADIYSLGCTLYFLIASRPPYQGDTLMATLLKHRDAPIPSIRDIHTDVPAELDALYAKMVAKTPAERIQTMAEVVRGLEKIDARVAECTNLMDTAILRLPEAACDAEFPSQELSFNLDSAVPAPANTIDLALPSATAGISSSVLLVEPSRTQSGIIRKFLQAQGVQQIHAVGSGREALHVLQSNSPGVILSAMHLSDMTGLELVKRIRKENNATAPGFILISSEAEGAEAGTLSGYGAAVLLHKPFTPEQLAEALRLVSDKTLMTPVAKHAQPQGKVCVLIVDDSAPARRHIRTVLERMGVTQFVEAPDGAQAVAALARQVPGLIVTDYNMPLMDGRSLVAYLKQNPATETVPIIMATTEQDRGKLEEVRGFGVTVCDKTFPMEVVQRVVEKLM